jgi:methylated-DNA-[protein]-cysteine S-methyltransferase
LYFEDVHTPHGTFQIAATERGLCGVHFPGRRTCVTKNGKIPAQAEKMIQAGQNYLKRYFSRRSSPLRRISVDLRFSSSFDAKVLQSLRSVPAGETRTYSQLAKQCGSPRAARAAGNALNRNPIPIVIPCHRVVRKDGSLGGFSGGLRWKKLLLRLEGVRI